MDFEVRGAFYFITKQQKKHTQSITILFGQLGFLSVMRAGSDDIVRRRPAVVSPYSWTGPALTGPFPPTLKSNQDNELIHWLVYCSLHPTNRPSVLSGAAQTSPACQICTDRVAHYTVYVTEALKSQSPHRGCFVRCLHSNRRTIDQPDGKTSPVTQADSEQCLSNPSHTTLHAIHLCLLSIPA